LDCLGALEAFISAAGCAGSGLIFRRDAAEAAALRGLRGGWSFFSGLGSRFLRGFRSLGGGCGGGMPVAAVWLVLPLVGAGCGVADVNRDAESSKSGYAPTRIVEFGASPAR
jgi:hypothetical protein